MTPALSDATADVRVLARIFLAGVTLHYATRGGAMSDGNYYEGRLHVGTINNGFSSFVEPKVRFSPVTVAIEDRDGAVRAMLDQYAWGNREVHLLVGVGPDLADYTTDFRGIVRLPGGVRRTDAAVHLALRDIRHRDSVQIPPNIHLPGDTPNLERKSWFKAIPVVYGDWTAGAGNQTLPAVCIDTTVPRFRVADHPLGSLTSVYRNGAPVGFSNVDLANAVFDLDAAYDPDSDTITCQGTGITSGGALLDNAADIIGDLLVTYAGLARTDLDADALARLRSNVAEIKCRGHLSEQRSSNTILQELANDIGFDLFVSGGLYTARFREPTALSGTTLGDPEMFTESFAVERDPERLYANRFVASYRFDPGSGLTDGLEIAEDTGEQTAAGAVVQRRHSFRWLYRTADVRLVLARWKLLFIPEIEAVTATLRRPGLGVGVGDALRLSHDAFSDRPLQVRATSKDLRALTNTVEAWDVLSFLSIGRWAADDAPNYANASADERKERGFWTDENGEAAPGDPGSAVSRWY